MSKIKGLKGLQRSLDALAKYNSLAHVERARIAEYSERKFGRDPADVDYDEFIDSCDGGCGLSSGMKAEDFITGMVERTKR